MELSAIGVGGEGEPETIGIESTLEQRERESQLMFVTTENSVLHLPRLSNKWSPFMKNIVGKGECGAYTGVVKGVYMRGMVIELDKEVWLLLSDQLLTAPHSLRVGAIVSKISLSSL